MIFGWSIYDKNITDNIIKYHDITVAKSFEYFWNRRKNNKRLVLLIDQIKTKSLNELIKISILIT